MSEIILTGHKTQIKENNNKINTHMVQSCQSRRCSLTQYRELEEVSGKELDITIKILKVWTPEKLL